MSSSGSVACELGVTVRFLHHQVVVSLSGELDLVSAPDLRSVLAGVIDGGHHDFVVDMGELRFLDLAGLRVVTDISTQLRRLQGSLTIRSPSATTRRMFDIASMNRFIEVEALDPAAPAPGSEQRRRSSTVAHQDVADLSISIARVAATPTVPEIVVAVLEMVAAIASATVAGADGVSVSLIRQGRLTTVASSDDTVAQMDRDQYATGQGPCLAAADEGRWFHIESLAQEARWPSFVPRAVEGGIGSILSTPLMVADRPIGALNIYSRTERAFGPREQELAGLFASHAAVMVAGAMVDVTAEGLAKRLQGALRVREVIAQAQGMVMARDEVSAETAYASLRRFSTQADIPMRLLAARMLASTSSDGRHP